MIDSRTSEQIARLPCWQGRVEIAPLVGGMTNRNYLVTDAGAGRFVVRIGSDIPEHGVMRFNELAAARAAHAAGISPEVVFAAEGVLVSRYIKSHTLTPEDVRDPRNFARIIELIRRCHHDVPRHFRGPALAFWVFQIIRNYFALLDGVPGNSLSPELSRLRSMAGTLEAAVGPITLVMGHNDLLAANFLDDGQRLWLIDWDYAGLNSPLFDLANLSSNNGFDDALDQQLLRDYFGQPVDAACLRAFAAMKCASLLRETLWGGVSELRSSIDFDYPRYTRDYLQRLDNAWDEFQHG
jgi:thiamine kinase-like enzyme